LEGTLRLHPAISGLLHHPGAEMRMKAIQVTGNNPGLQAMEDRTEILNGPALVLKDTSNERRL